MDKDFAELMLLKLLQAGDYPQETLEEALILAIDNNDIKSVQHLVKDRKCDNQKALDHATKLDRTDIIQWCNHYKTCNDFKNKLDHDLQKSDIEETIGTHKHLKL